MQGTEPRQDRLAVLGEQHPHRARVLGMRRTLDQTLPLRAIDQLHDAVVPELQPVGELPHRGPLPLRKAPEPCARRGRKMKQNRWWAAGYNLISVPLAAGVLAPVGFVLPMEVGALLMSLSTVVVALNAQLLRQLDLSPRAGVAAAHRAVPLRSTAVSRSQ